MLSVIVLCKHKRYRCHLLATLFPFPDSSDNRSELDAIYEHLQTEQILAALPSCSLRAVTFPQVIHVELRIKGIPDYSQLGYVA